MAYHDMETDFTGIGAESMFGVPMTFAEKAAAVAAAQARRVARSDAADPVAEGIRIAAQLGHCPGAIIKHLRAIERAALSAAGDVVHRAREGGL